MKKPHHHSLLGLVWLLSVFSLHAQDASTPDLICSIDVPTIVGDIRNLRYDPMPFALTMTVTNAGVVARDSLWATITLPKDLELAAPDIPDCHTKRVMPSLLFPNQSGTVQWMLRHPLTDVEKHYVVTVWVWTSNGDSSKCEASVLIPALDKPILQSRCFIPTLTFDKSANRYVPNPFTLRLTTVNQGNSEARNVIGTIILPPDVEFDPPDQAATKTFTPSTMGKYIPPTEAPELTWTVRFTKRYLVDTTLQFHFAVTGQDSQDWPLDTTKLVGSVVVPKLWPMYSSCIDIPDSLSLNAFGNGLEPNPFVVRYEVRNKGFNTGVLREVKIQFQQDGQRLHPSSPLPMTVPLHVALQPGESMEFEWLLQVDNRSTRRQYSYSFSVLTEEGFTWKDEEWLPIASVPVAPSPVLQPREILPAALVFDESADSYVPNPFSFRLTVRNVSAAVAHNVTGTIILPPGMEFDPPGQSATQLFSPSAMGQYVPPAPVPEVMWTLRWTKRYRYDMKVEFRCTVTGTDDMGVQLDSVEVWSDLTIPGLQPAFACSMEMPDSLGLNAAGTDVEPNPFTVRYTIRNSSYQVGSIRRVYISLPPDGISLHPTSRDPLNQMLDLVLDKGESRTFEWIIGVQNRITRRDVRISVMALDDEGTPIECADNLPIANLRTELHCEATAQPPGLFYDAALREYNPSTFIVSARLRNAGGMTLHDVAAELTWSDTSGLDLLEFDSGVPGQANPVTWAVLQPDSSVEAHWAMRLKNPNISGRPWYPNFLVRYVSRETAQIRNGCEVPVVVGPTDSPVLQCTLNAPDSVRFVDDRYQPGSFDVGFELRNIGKAEARNVKAYLLQGKGFTIESPSFIDLPPVPVGWSIDRPDAFRVRVLLREMDGYDTIRIAVVADGISTQCEIPVFVERELRPRFELTCVADAALHFDELSNDYVPNPLPLRTSLRNVGGTRARQVAVTFTGPPSFTPFNQIMTQTLGDIAVGEERSLDWMLVPLRRDNAGVEDVRFELQARSGIDDQVITEHCGVDVFVPAARRQDYQCFVSAPRIRVDSVRGGYDPDPFEVRARVSNIGQAMGRGLVAHAILPGGLTSISPLDVAMQDSLAPGAQSGDAVWTVRPLARSIGDSVVFRVLFTDAFGNSTECHLLIWIPGVPDAGVLLSCDAEVDSLVMFPGDTGYRKADFRVQAWIGNTGAASLYDVDVVLLALDTALSVISANPLRVASRLDAGGGSLPVEWTIHATPRDVAGWVRLQCIVSAKDAAGLPLPTRECAMWIYMQERRTPRLQCRVWTSATTADGQDTIIAFDPSTGYYEGVPSSNGAYPVLRVFLEVRNIGIVSASELAGTLLLPAIMSMDQGQTSVKRFEPSTLSPGAVDTVTWDVRPMAVEEDSVVRFTVLVNSREGETLQCEHVAVLQRVPAPVWLAMPTNLVGMRGQVIDVPVEIGRTDGRDVFSYYLGIRFNPSYLRFVDARNDGTVTAAGWDGVKATVVREQGRGASGLLRLHDRTTTSPLSSTKEGMLLRLRFEVLYSPKRFDLIDRSPLEFVLHAVDSLGRELRSTMNAVREEDAGEIGLVVSDGLVTLSGDCIWPLVATTELGQNHPNPFNPVTIIPFMLGQETDYSLTLHDVLGQLVRVLERGRSLPGAYTYTLDASELPSGMYFYRLVTAWSTQTKRLLLTR